MSCSPVNHAARAAFNHEDFFALRRLGGVHCPTYDRVPYLSCREAPLDEPAQQPEAVDKPVAHRGCLACPFDDLKPFAH
jgi:hypothetical protein